MGLQDAVHRQVKRDTGKNGLSKLKSGREKKLERKDNNLKRDATKEVSLLRFKQGVVVSPSAHGLGALGDRRPSVRPSDMHLHEQS